MRKKISILFMLVIMVLCCLPLNTYALNDTIDTTKSLPEIYEAFKEMDKMSDYIKEYVPLNWGNEYKKETEYYFKQLNQNITEIEKCMKEDISEERLKQKTENMNVSLYYLNMYYDKYLWVAKTEEQSKKDFENLVSQSEQTINKYSQYLSKYTKMYRKKNYILTYTDEWDYDSKKTFCDEIEDKIIILVNKRNFLSKTIKEMKNYTKDEITSKVYNEYKQIINQPLYDCDGDLSYRESTYNYFLKEAKQNAEAQAIVNQIAKKLNFPENMSDFKKIIRIDKWMCENYVYTKDSNNNNVYDVVKNKNMVCWGYAKIFKMLCQYYDIPCAYITGWPEDGTPGHAWNAVVVNGLKYYIDVTWDDKGDYSSQKYLLLSKEKMDKSHNHYLVNYQEDFRYIAYHNIDF